MIIFSRSDFAVILKIITKSNLSFTKSGYPKPRIPISAVFLLSTDK